MPIEALTIGDRVMTASGEARPIKWIGRRSYSGRFAATNRDLLPVQIKRGAMAHDQPRRDLLVAPSQALLLDGMLFPADKLVNGISILHIESVDQIAYYHVELDTHAIIRAEGLPVESFLDTGCRGMFHNAASYRDHTPQGGPEPLARCAEHVKDGPSLEATHLRLAARAARECCLPETASCGQLRGRLDFVTHERIEGWAQDTPFPDRRVLLRILDNDMTIGQIMADAARPDLAALGIGDGDHGFALRMPDGLLPGMRHVIQVQRAEDGQDLPGSPWLLDGAPVPSAAATAPALEGGSVAISESLDGRLDAVTRDRISGWARDAAQPDDPVSLQILDNGVLIGRVMANRYRADLEHSGLGIGRHGFELRIPGGLPPHLRHVIQVRRAEDGVELPQSPGLIEGASVFDAAMSASMAAALNGLTDEAAQDQALSFLVEQTTELLRRRAEIDGRQAARQAYAQFRRRWGAVAVDSMPDPGKRALVVDDLTPNPSRDAGSQVVISHIRSLRRLGYEVSFIAAAELAPQPGVLAQEDITICRAPWYASVEDVLRLQPDCFDVVYLHRISNAAKYLALVRQYSPRARVLYSVADLHHLRLARQAAVEQRPELLGESRRVRLAECTAAWSADAVLTHSAHEADTLHAAVPNAKVHVVPWDMPTRKPGISFARRRGIAFVGGYAHAPNVDAARFLAEEIMPIVWQTDQSVACLLVGSDMPEQIMRLKRPGIEPIGHVADLAEIFDRIRMTVAPLRYGAGVKGKVLASLAAGVPCVMSQVAAEGIDLPPALQTCVGVDAASIAACILRLHANTAACRKAEQAGLDFIAKRFGQTALDEALLAAIEGRRPRPSAGGARKPK